MKYLRFILPMLVVFIMSAAGAMPSWHASPDVEAAVELPDLTECYNQTVGARVFYLEENDFDYVSLGMGLHMARDPNYLAFGVFEGGGTQQVGSKTYRVFTILAGYSYEADWCEGPVSSQPRPGPGVSGA